MIIVEKNCFYIDKTSFIKEWWENGDDVTLITRPRRFGKTLTMSMVECFFSAKYAGRSDLFENFFIWTDAIWSLLLARGYLKVSKHGMNPATKREEYELELTNMEVRLMFEDMVKGWFSKHTIAYNQFIEALLLRNVKAMNNYMNRVVLQTFSYFDTGNIPSEKEPERFYHGFVLGLIVDLNGRYTVSSNRELPIRRKKPHL